MALFRHILIVALLAGLAAGLLTSAAHQFGTVPLILKAEVYEQAAGHPDAEAAHEHGGGNHAWAPADGTERLLATALADVLAAIGFALLLACAYALRGEAVGWRRGLVWGLAGFVVFALAPGLGSPPELPGTAAAPLLDRQVWWLGTALATAGGLALLAFRRRPALIPVALALIVAPHLIGAPQPDRAHAAAPEGLAREFVVAALVSSLVFWIALGALTGYFHDRIGRA